MKKILNWTFGACFRTLGRFLAIFIVGLLLVFIGSKIGFKLPDWLGIAHVNAAYADGWIRNYDQLSRVNLYEINSSSLTALDVYVEQVYLQDADEDYNVSQYRDMFYYDNFDGFTVGQRGFIYEFGIDKTLNKNYLYSYSVAFCTNQDSFGTNYDIETYGGWYGTSWSEGANTNTDTLQYNSLNSLSTKPFGGTGTNNFKSCYQMNGYIVPDHNIAFMHLHFNKKSGTKSGVMVYMLGAKIEAQGIYTEAIEDIFSNVVENGGLATGEQMEQVQEQVDNVQQEIQDTNDTINNSDTTGAQDSAGGFFDDFQSEDFGLSSIVTAPLRGINAMLNDSCVAPSATYKGQNFSLPCGSMLWNRPGGEDFKSFMNVMYGGFLAYLVIRKFFLDVENLKNPDNDKVEVDKL